MYCLDCHLDLPLRRVEVKPKDWVARILFWLVMNFGKWQFTLSFKNTEQRSEAKRLKEEIMYRMFIKTQKKELIDAVGKQGGGFILAEILICQHFELAEPDPEARKHWHEIEWKGRPAFRG